MKCGCHPDCGAGTILFVNKRTKQMVPLSSFHPHRAVPSRRAGDRRRGGGKERQPRRSSASRSFATIVRETHHPGMISATLSVSSSPRSARGPRIGASAGDALEFDWRILFVAGMCSRISSTMISVARRCGVIPYGTRFGEISFCAYNSGIGWRQIVEKRTDEGEPSPTGTGSTDATPSTRAISHSACPPSTIPSRARCPAIRRMPTS